MTMAIRFGRGLAAESMAQGHADALRSSSATTRGGTLPPIPRCDLLLGLVSLGRKATPCGCTDPARPLDSCDYTTREVVRKRKLRSGEWVVYITPAHVEGEIIDGHRIWPSLGEPVIPGTDQPARPLDPTDDTGASRALSPLRLKGSP